MSYLKINERKQQFIGRKALACIDRKLSIDTDINVEIPFSLTSISFAGFVTLEPFKRLTEEQRRIQISTSLLGGVTLSNLVEESQIAESINNEAHFRLKSKWRSLLIVDPNAFNYVSKMYESEPNPSVLLEILEDAMIESKLPLSYQYFNRKIRTLASDYGSLKSLLIKLTLAGSFNNETLEELIQVLEESDDQNIQSLVSLTLSNFVLDLKKANSFQYRQITDRLLTLYKSTGPDTLQYIYIVGNAGIVSEEKKLVSLLRSSFEEEAILALRHIHSLFADSVVTSFILKGKGLGASYYTALLPDRELSSQFIAGLSRRIIQADKNGDGSFLPALQFLLDYRFRKSLDLSLMLGHKFKTKVYVDELEESRKQASLCMDLQ